MKKIFSNQTFRYILFGAAGLLLGWALFHSSPQKEEAHNHAAEEAKSEIWTCSMHPQIRMDKAGKCPICAMDLIPVSQSGGAEMDATAIHFTKEAAQLANVMTSVVSTQNPVKVVRLYGKVEADERLLHSQVSFLSGRIEKLMVNFTGETVQKGQTLAIIYSPDLVTAQQELLEAAKTKDSQPEIYEAAKEKLRQWKLTETQISGIENSGQVKANMEITAASGGIVTARRVNNGDYVSQGSVLYDVSDLSRVWVQFDAYESDLPFLKKGGKIEFTIQALPGSAYSGTIAFIDPFIDPVNRVAKVRVEMGNPGGKLKPGMFATGLVNANLDEFNNKLVIPRSAVLWTGKRSVVYVKQPGEEPIFHLREVELGPALGNSYVVIAGLADGEEIVTEGAFSVDAAAQLEGKPSMMNPSGGIVSTGHNHGTVEPDAGGEDHSAHQNQTVSIGGEHQNIKVSGNCEMCKERIETAAKSIAGVSSAEWSAETKLLHVSFDGAKTNIDAIQKAIAKAGHDTEKYKTPDEVYNALPECCLYDRVK